MHNSAATKYWFSINSGLVLSTILFVVTIVLYFGVFLHARGSLPGRFDITSTLNGSMPLVFAAVAQSFALISGGIDLSIGGVISLSNALASVLIGDSPQSIFFAVVCVLAAGAICGLVNGLLITWGRLQPLLATLGTFSVFQGVAIYILPTPGGYFPGTVSDFLVNGSYPTACLFVVAIALFWYIFRRTRFGIDMIAIGSDAQAAQSNGVAESRAIIGAYMCSGIFAAIAGLFLAANSSGGDSTAGNLYTLSSVVAAVIGGVSLKGGRGSALGAVLGALISNIIVNILFFSGIDPLYQNFYEGFFLIVSVVVVGLSARLFRVLYR